MIKDLIQYDLFGKRTFVKAVIKSPFRIAAQMKDEACFYYVITGCAAVLGPTEKLMLEANDGLVMQCGNYFNDYVPRQGMEYCEAIAVHFYPEVLQMLYDKDFPDFLTNVKTNRTSAYDHVKADAVLKNYIENLKFYFDNPDLVSEELLKLKMKELILLLAKTENVEALKSLFGGLFDQVKHDFKEVIEANLYNNLSLNELALLTNLSLSSFKREFMKCYATSPAKYIKKRKLEKAARLLSNTSSRVTDIAFDCGFGDIPNFSKSFLKEFGNSPTAYRSKHSI